MLDVRCFLPNWQWPLLLISLLCLTGCATHRAAVADPRRFSFEHDTFAFANELKWEYHFEPDGKWKGTRREPEPDYALHCFVVARSCRQFFQNATFDPSQPKADDATYRKLVDKVVSVDPRHDLENKIVIPGYADLRSFSSEHERLLKEECGGAWQSYCQRGNWRMVFPFSRNHQEKTAEQLYKQIARGKVLVAHVVRFPDLSINHAVVLFDVSHIDNNLEFRVYDPNEPDGPTTLTFDREKRAFSFPQNDYFAGGSVDVYEIYRSLFY